MNTAAATVALGFTCEGFLWSSSPAVVTAEVTMEWLCMVADCWQEMRSEHILSGGGGMGNEVHTERGTNAEG